MNLHQEIFSNCFFNFLLEVARSIAAEAQEKGCYCGQKLDVANFMRSGRGPPAGPKKELLRFSFCCRGDACRKRVTPDSVRFTRGKTYVSLQYSSCMLSIPASLLESFDLEEDSPPNDFLKLLHFLAPLRISSPF